MDTIGLIVMVIVLVLVIGGIFGYIKTQRELVNLDEKCKNALSQIEVQLNSRWDALMRRGVEIRTAADVNEQQDAFSEVLSRLMAVNEAYPELKASGLYEKTMSSINAYEDNVRMARMIYNDTTTRFNRYVRQWPSSMVAGQLHFVARDYLAVDNKGKRDMPELFGAE